MDPLAYYAEQSPFTDPGKYAERLRSLPDDLAGLSRIVRGLVVHYRLGHLSDYEIPDDRLPEVDSRYAERMLARIVELDDRPLTEERPPQKRLVGCCRDFTVLFLTMARHKNIPARARVGFADYFVPGFDADHEIAEVWDRDEERWRLVDPQTSAPSTGEHFDTMDVPRDRFLVAGAAWQACRDGRADAETFLVDPGMDNAYTRGWPQIRHNLVQELAALDKTEMLLWDVWEPDEEEVDDEALDEVAALTRRDDVLTRLRGIYEKHPGLKAPAVVKSYSPAFGPREVRLTA